MIKTNPDIYLLFGIVGILLNLIIMFFSLRGKYTPTTLAGVSGWQGDRGTQGNIGIKGVKGLRGKKGKRGNYGNHGAIGLIGAYSGDSAGKRIYCSSDDCIKKNTTYHAPTSLTDGVRVWPSDECINAGNFQYSTLGAHNVSDNNNHHIKCGYNWIWSDRQSANSCVKDIGDDLYKNSEVRWISGARSLASPTLASIKGGYGVSKNNLTCKNECPECPGRNTRTKVCGNLKDSSRPPRVEGTCQRETLDQLSTNALIFCCNQDGSDIEKNIGTVCKPKITEYCNNNDNLEECKAKMGFSADLKFRDTVKSNDKRCSMDADNNLPGGNNNIRNWCVDSWGCCRALTGVRRMRHESWRDAYCRTLQMGWIRAANPRNLVSGTNTMYQPISDKEKTRLESKEFVCRYVTNPNKFARAIDSKGVGPCSGRGCHTLVQEVSDNFKAQTITGGYENGQLVPKELDNLKTGESTNFWSFLGENNSWGSSAGNPYSSDGGRLGGKMRPITSSDNMGDLYDKGELFFQCIHKDNLRSGSNLSNLKKCQGT
jgi:hypothetical protein